MIATLPVYGDPLYAFQPRPGAGTLIPSGVPYSDYLYTTGVLDGIVVSHVRVDSTDNLSNSVFRAHRVNDDGSVTSGPTFDLTAYNELEISWSGLGGGTFVAYGYWQHLATNTDAGLRVDLLKVNSTDLSISILDTKTLPGIAYMPFAGKISYHPDLHEALFANRIYDTASNTEKDLSVYRVPVTATTVGDFPAPQTVPMTGVSPNMNVRPKPHGTGTYLFWWSVGLGGSPYYADVYDPVAGTIVQTTIDSDLLTDVGRSLNRPRNVVLDASGVDLKQITIADNGDVTDTKVWANYTDVCNAYLDALGLGAPGELHVNGVISPNNLTWTDAGGLVFVQEVYNVNIPTDDWYDTPIFMMVTDPFGTPTISLYRSPGLADDAAAFANVVLGMNGQRVVFAETYKPGTTITSAAVEQWDAPTQIWGKVKPDSGSKVIEFTVANTPIYGGASLYPGSDAVVADTGDVGGTPHPWVPPSSIVGSGDILSDSDDATLLRPAYFNNAASSGGAANTDASIDLPSIPAGDYQPGTFGWNVRVSGELSGTTDAVPNLRILLMSNDLATIYADARVDPLPMGGAPQEFSGSLTFYGTAGYAAMEAGTARLWFIIEQSTAPTTTTDYMFVANVYEAHLTYQTQIGYEISRMTLLGPSTPDQGDSNRHHGMFGIDPQFRHASVRFKVGSTDHDVWVQPKIRYFSITNDLVVGQGEVRLPATQVLAAPKWSEVNQYVEKVPEDATHYLIDAELYGDAALSQILPNGTRIYFDSIFVPDGGHDLRDDKQPYLDGDQPGAIWEGTPENSTSVYGEKPRTPNSMMTLLDDDLPFLVLGTSTPTTPGTPPDTPPPPDPITEP